jgi:hypothetical protein
MARAILKHICDSPTPSMGNLCDNDPTSKGPYIFTYATPASKLEPLPPPYLFVDLSDLSELGFRTILSDVRVQVMREDYTDLERINTLKNRVLKITLKAADLLPGVIKFIIEIVHYKS